MVKMENYFDHIIHHIKINSIFRLLQYPSNPGIHLFDQYLSNLLSRFATPLNKQRDQLAQADPLAYYLRQCFDLLQCMQRILCDGSA